jgi:pyrophosphatase PpaX
MRPVVGGAERGPIDAVLFDLDGTLLDTTEAIISSLKHTVRRFTGRTPDVGELHPYMGLPLADIFSELLPGNVEEACRVYVEHNVAVHKELVRPYPGVPETLRILQRWGVKRALVTSKRRTTVDLGLEVAGLADAFDAVVCHGDTPRAKPDPAPVLLAIELLGLNKPETGEIVFVGDSPWDLQAARNAAALLPRLKIRSAAVTYGATAREVLVREDPDYVLDDIKEVLSLCNPEYRTSQR